MEYNGHKFTFVDKKITMDGMGIWFDADNQIGDTLYYDTFEDWVIDNYFDYIDEWEAKWIQWMNDSKVENKD